MTRDARDRSARLKGELLLDIRGLRVEGQSDNSWREIVMGVDLTVRRGEVLGLIGESGAGKSTIGLAAMGFARTGCRITSGSIVFDGIELMQTSEPELQKLRGSRMAYVAQSAAAAFNPAFRLLEQTIETETRHGIRRRMAAIADAKSLYRQLRLPDPENIGFRYPHQASGGQLQRVMTAMAVSCRPDLIVFDEPTTALDVTTQVEVLAAMRSIVDEFKVAAIYITHDLAVVAQMAHRTMVLRYGKVVEQASTREMLANPKEAYTRSLWAVRRIAKPQLPADGDLLSIDRIQASYSDGAMVLDDVSLRVPRGRTVAVVGESGSGKSSLARVVTGLLTPSKGIMRFDGQALPDNCRTRSKDLLRRIQMIYQTPDTALNPRHRVYEVIGRPLKFFHGLAGEALEEEIFRLLRVAEMTESHIDRLPMELSGGEKQRICIARALAAKPDLIICDEVTSALDQIVQEDILKLLLTLQRNLGVSYLFISHDIATVRAIADEIVVMHKGRVVQQGAPRQRSGATSSALYRIAAVIGSRNGR
jgi:peptide/nickel transport system ATP-binding protein